MQMKKLFALTTLTIALHFGAAVAQDGQQLVSRVRDKLNRVKDYRADGVLKTNITFMKVPDSKVTVFYRNPDKFRVKKDEGISVVPKGGISINLNSLFSGNEYTAIIAGNTSLNGKDLTIVKLIPVNEENDVVISTLQIDPQTYLIHKASTTTKNNGTYNMALDYGRFAEYGLPDKVIFTFNTKDYKLPKGVTFEYDPGTKAPEKTEKKDQQQGTVEIVYSNYVINKGISDEMFKP
jgi:outer membrane lipoprotein-sorting protein